MGGMQTFLPITCCRDAGERMQKLQPTLHMFCGKIAAGKSTLAAQLGEGSNTVLVSEDHFLAHLYPGEILTLEDYARCAVRLRQAMGPHIANLLRSGLSVVLDFQANTLSARAWMRHLIETAHADHQLHYLRADDAICKERLTERNASGAHEYQVSDADFDLFNSYVVVPGPDEGFKVILHDQR
jgi:predicted kinase